MTTVLLWITSAVSISLISLVALSAISCYMDRASPPNLCYIAESVSDVYEPLLHVYLAIRRFIPHDEDLHRELRDKVISEYLEIKHLDFFDKETITSFIEELVEWHAGRCSSSLRSEFERLFYYYGKQPKNET